MRILYIAMALLLVNRCSSYTEKDGTGTNPLIGKWKYVDCSIKNTFINGTITFRSDGKFRLDAVAHDDYPVPEIKGTYTYRISGPMIFTDYDKGYGMSQYFYINGDELIFSDVPPAYNTDLRYWRYKLVRVK